MEANTEDDDMQRAPSHQHRGFTSRHWRVVVMGSLLAVWLGQSTASAVIKPQDTAQGSTTAASDRLSLTGTTTKQGALSATVHGPGNAAAHVPNRVLVKFKSRTSRAFLNGSGPARGFSDPALFVVDNPSGVSVEEALHRYRHMPDVVYAEPDYLVEALTTPTDPLWSNQWDMTKIATPQAWDSQTDASDVVVAIVDTGVDFTHPDLQANLWTNLADGAHGYTCMGGTVVAGGADDYGHGPHVAGTIGAVANNGIGIAGINWKVKLASFKFLDSSGSGTISDAINCFNKVLQLKQSGVNIRVTNNSWGGGGYSQALKDAMTAVESAGVGNACAAGNSNVNTDISPMFPGGYDNRGIISVLATDSSDLRATFSNYGLATADIGAPGVKTLSTVPTSTCPLCDPSGYKYLSGTSMATPHVAGVLAALFHKNPALTAYQARDEVLDYASYDAIPSTDTSGALQTSTAGRLNLYKALNNPLLLAPKLNGFPTLNATGNLTLAAGTTGTLTATASDPDNDPLRIQWLKNNLLSPGNWLMSVVMNQFFPNPGSNTSFSLTAPSFARTATVGYSSAVADGRGGSAQGSGGYVTVLPSFLPGQPPSGTMSVTPTDAPAGSTFTINVPVTDPEGKPVLWDFRENYKGGWSSQCCYSTSPLTFSLSTADVYRIDVQAMDQELNTSPNYTAVVHVGGAVGEPPIARAAIDKLSGSVPLTVNWDASASSDADGTIQNYYVFCEGTGFAAPSSVPTGSCTYDTPGPHSIEVVVSDNDGYVDSMYLYVNATPAGSGGSSDTAAPTVSLTSPLNGATVSGTTTVSASASDNVGVTKVEFYVDGTLKGSDTSSPYSVTWDTTTATNGNHTLLAKASDAAGNVGSSASVSVTVSNSSDTTPPTVSLSASPGGPTYTSAQTLTLTAAASDNVGVTKVEFYDGTLLKGTSTTSPYTVNWPITATDNGTHPWITKAYDAAGNSTVSAALSLTVNIDTTAPTVSLTSPANGATVSGTITLSATASDNVGVSRVDFYVDGGLLGSSNASPYSLSWNTLLATNGSHTLLAKASDAAGNVGASATVTVTVNNVADITPPVVTLTSPANGATLPAKGSVSVSATASDASGISQIVLAIDGAVKKTCVAVTTCSYSWAMSKVSSGTHTITAKATDTASPTPNTASASISVVKP